MCLDALKLQGYEFVTVTELARLTGQAIEPGKVYMRFS